MGSSNPKSARRIADENEIPPQQQRRQEAKRALVRKKLLKLDQSLTPEQLEERVLVLSDCEKMKKEWFGSILLGMDDAVTAVVDESAAHSRGLRNRMDRQLCAERLSTEFDNVQSVEVKLVLYELSRGVSKKLASALHGFAGCSNYGPFHAALVLGGVVLEWDNSSLVIPRRATAEDDWIFQGNIHQPVINHLSGLPLRAGAAETGHHFDTIIEEIKNIRMEKEQLVDELVTVAVQYNTKYTYGLFSNNCQHFVTDCLHVLSITNKEEMFSGRLKDHAAVLMKKGLKGCEEFNSHQDLDDYVRENLQNMNPSELEFCLCHYLLFHAFHKASPKEAWQCQSDTCLQSQVEKRLQDYKRTELD